MKYLTGALMVFVAFLATGNANGQNQHPKEEKISLRTSAIRINVDDMEKARNFYVETLGFGVEDESKIPMQVFLTTNDRVNLILNKVEKLRKWSASETKIQLALQVNDLDQSIKRMRARKITFAGGIQKAGVGQYIRILDPFGREISLLHQTVVKTPTFREPKVYNFGVLVPDMKAGIEFYSKKLGFVVRSKSYLPAALPLGHTDGSFGFMLHHQNGIEPIKRSFPDESPFNTMVFEAANVEAVYRGLSDRQVKIIDKKYSLTKKINSFSFEDPFGNVSEVFQKTGDN